MIEFKRLTHEDYEDILDISKDIWEGDDYLPKVFHEWVEGNGFFAGAVDTEKNKVVGVGKYTILNDKSGWLEGLRVHKDYRGQKIARGISEFLLNEALKDLSEKNIRRIGFGTHLTNIESITMMAKFNFMLKQQYMLVSKRHEKLDPGLRLENFKVMEWNISYEEFKALDYFKRRQNIMPLAFIFQEITEDLFNDLKKNHCLVTINGHDGIYKVKGDSYFIAVDDSFEGIDTFMNYYLLYQKDKNIPDPITSVIPEDKQLITRLRTDNFEAWADWKPDYLYYVYES